MVDAHSLLYHLYYYYHYLLLLTARLDVVDAHRLERIVEALRIMREGGRSADSSDQGPCTGWGGWRTARPRAGG